MAKEMVKKAGAAATESILASFMPQLFARLDAMESRMDSRFTEMERRIDERFSEMERRMDERFAKVDERFAKVDQRFEKIDQRFIEVDVAMHNLRQDMNARFDQMHDLLNELGMRVLRGESKLEAYTSMLRDQSGTMERWIERVVKVEMLQKSGRRKAS